MQNEKSKTNELFTLKDVATTLNVAPYRITYLITSRQVEELALRIGNVRVWKRPEVQVIAEKLNIEIGECARKKEHGPS